MSPPTVVDFPCTLFNQKERERCSKESHSPLHVMDYPGVRRWEKLERALLHRASPLAVEGGDEGKKQLVKDIIEYIRAIFK